MHQHTFERSRVGPAVFVGFLALLVIVFALAGCSAKAGRITEKVYQPPEEVTVQEPFTMPDGTILFLPQTHTSPDEYGFKLIDERGRTGYVRVSLSIWNHFDEGDYFSF